MRCFIGPLDNVFPVHRVKSEHAEVMGYQPGNTRGAAKRYRFRKSEVSRHPAATSVDREKGQIDGLSRQCLRQFRIRHRIARMINRDVFKPKNIAKVPVFSAFIFFHGFMGRRDDTQGAMRRKSQYVRRIGRDQSRRRQSEIPRMVLFCPGNNKSGLGLCRGNLRQCFRVHVIRMSMSAENKIKPR